VKEEQSKPVQPETSLLGNPSFQGLIMTY